MRITTNIYTHDYNLTETFAMISISATIQEVGKRKPFVGKPKPWRVSEKFDDLETLVSFVKDLFQNGICDTDKKWVIIDPITDDLLEKVITDYNNGMNDVIRKREIRKNAIEKKEKLLKETEKFATQFTEVFPHHPLSDSTREAYLNGEAWFVHHGGEKLGNCFHRCNYMVFLNGMSVENAIPRIPKGNGENYSITEEGVHYMFGKYLVTSCDVDSSG